MTSAKVPGRYLRYRARLTRESVRHGDDSPGSAVPPCGVRGAPHGKARRDPIGEAKEPTMADNAGEVTDSTGTTARPAEDPGIDPADMAQGSPLEADSEVADPDGNDARGDDGDGNIAADSPGLGPLGAERFGLGGVTLDR